MELPGIRGLHDEGPGVRLEKFPNPPGRSPHLAPLAGCALRAQRQRMCRHLRPPTHPPGPPLIHRARASAFPLALAPSPPALSLPKHRPPRTSLPAPYVGLCVGTTGSRKRRSRGRDQVNPGTRGCHSVTGRGDSIRPAARHRELLASPRWFFFASLPSPASTHRVPPWLFPALAAFPFLSPRLCPVMTSSAQQMSCRHGSCVVFFFFPPFLRVINQPRNLLPPQPPLFPPRGPAAASAPS